jgi:hypothetical protein
MIARFVSPDTKSGFDFEDFPEELPIGHRRIVKFDKQFSVNSGLATLWRKRRDKVISNIAVSLQGTLGEISYA